MKVAKRFRSRAPQDAARTRKYVATTTRFFSWVFAIAIGLGFFLPAPLHAQADGAQRWAFSTLVSSSTQGKILSSPAIAGDGTIYIGVEVGLSTSTNPSG